MIALCGCCLVVFADFLISSTNSYKQVDIRIYLPFYF